MEKHIILYMMPDFHTLPTPQKKTLEGNLSNALKYYLFYFLVSAFLNVPHSHNEYVLYFNQKKGEVFKKPS